MVASIDDVEWLEPWVRLRADSAGLAKELQRETNRQHALHGVRAVPVARRTDCDDVLFALSGHAPPLAVVHLTWRRESDPQWPATAFYASWQDWVERCLRRDHEEFMRLSRPAE